MGFRLVVPADSYVYRAFFSALCVLSPLGCTSDALTFSAAVTNPFSPLTPEPNDVLFYLQIERLAERSPVSTFRVLVSGAANSSLEIDCASPTGLQEVIAGSTLECREPDRNVFGPSDAGKTFNVLILHKGSENGFSTTWTAITPER